MLLRCYLSAFSGASGYRKPARDELKKKFVRTTCKAKLPSPSQVKMKFLCCRHELCTGCFFKRVSLASSSNGDSFARLWTRRVVANADTGRWTWNLLVGKQPQVTQLEPAATLALWDLAKSRPSRFGILKDLDALHCSSVALRSKTSARCCCLSWRGAAKRHKAQGSVDALNIIGM